VKRLLNWLLECFTIKPVRQRVINSYQVVPRDICRLRLAEWKSSTELVLQAKNCMNDVLFRRMIDVLENEHPASIVLMDNTSLETRAIWQARCEGYTMALANIDAMTVYNKPTESLEATFDPAEPETA